MKKIHYGWAVCIGSTVMLLIGGGLSVNAFSVTQPYILTLNGFSNTQTSMITTVRSLTYLLCMALTPVYYKKLGYRLGMTVATFLSVVSFGLFALAKTAGVYYLAGAVAGFSYGFGSTIPAAVLVSRWFHKKQGLSLGIASAGTGLATVVFSPVLTWLTDTFSLPVCFWFEAVISLAGTVTVWLLIRDDPEKCGLLPYGDRENMPSPVSARKPICPGRFLWALLFVSMAFMGSIASPGFSHFMILYTSSGIPEGTVSGAVSVFGLALMGGKCLFGASCDRIGTKATNYLFSALLLCGLGLCLFASDGSVSLMYTASVLFGLGVPMSTVGLAIWAGDMSTPEGLEHTVQRFQLCYAIGGLAFSFVPGMLADISGSYIPAYLMFFLQCVFSVAVIVLAYRKVENEKL